MGVCPFAFRYQGNGAAPCQYIDITALVDFLLTVIELLFYLLPLTRYKAKRVKTHCFLEGVGDFEPRFQGKRSSLGNIFLVSRKLDTFCYLKVQTAPCYVQSFWHNNGVWQTDRQTDGIAIAGTALAMGALRRAVKRRLAISMKCLLKQVRVKRPNFAKFWLRRLRSTTVLDPIYTIQPVEQPAASCKRGFMGTSVRQAQCRFRQFDRLFVHCQVTIIFVVSVGLSVCLCRVFLRRLWSDFDQTRTYVICLNLVVSPRI